MSAIDFKAAFDGMVRSRAKVWAHDRSKTVGASEVFGCIRRTFFGKTGTPVDADYDGDWGAMQRGNLIEDHHFVPGLQHLVGLLPTAGLEMTSANEGGQETLFAPDAPLSATPDALIDGVHPDALSKYGVPDLRVPAHAVSDLADMLEFADHCFTVECKSIDPRVELDEAKAIHQGQVIAQLGVIRETTCYRPHYGVILYFDASFLSAVDVFVVPFDPVVYGVAKERARTVYAATRADQLRREGAFDDSCKTCPYESTCAQLTVGAIPAQPEKKGRKVETDPEFARTLEPLVKAQQRAKAEADRVSREASELSERIKFLLREHQASRAGGEGWSVSYYPQNGKESLDKGAIEADGLDPSKYLRRGNPFEVLKVTAKPEFIAD